jgi:hypothetical protein
MPDTLSPRRSALATQLSGGARAAGSGEASPPHACPGVVFPLPVRVGGGAAAS